MVGYDVGCWVKPESALSSHLHLGAPYVLLLEEKLPVQVAHFDCVQIDLQVGATKPCSTIGLLHFPTYT